MLNECLKLAAEELRPQPCFMPKKVWVDGNSQGIKQLSLLENNEQSFDHVAKVSASGMSWLKHEI